MIAFIINVDVFKTTLNTEICDQSIRFGHQSRPQFNWTTFFQPINRLIGYENNYAYPPGYLG